MLAHVSIYTSSFTVWLTSGDNFDVRPDMDRSQTVEVTVETESIDDLPERASTKADVRVCSKDAS